MTEEQFRAQSAIEKLSHLLQTRTEDLQFLGNFGAEKVMLLHNLVAERLQHDPSPLWERLAKVTAFIPNFINARIATDILGAHITANLTYHVPVKEALSIAKHFSPAFMAEVAEQLVPARAVELIRSFPLADMKKITRELLKNEKYYTMGTFVDVLPVATLHELAREIPNEAQLLRIAIYANNKAHLAEMITGFDNNRILRIVNSAEALHLWPEIIGIVSHFDDNMRRKIAALIPQFTDNELISMIRSACSLTIPEDIVIMTRLLDDEQKIRLASFIPALADSDIIALVRAAHKTREQEQILQIARHLDEKEKRRLATLLPLFSDEELLSLIGSAFPAGLVAVVLEIASYAPEEEMPRIRQLVNGLGPQKTDEARRVAGELSAVERIRELFG